MSGNYQSKQINLSQTFEIIEPDGKTLDLSKYINSPIEFSYQKSPPITWEFKETPPIEWSTTADFTVFSNDFYISSPIDYSGFKKQFLNWSFKKGTFKDWTPLRKWMPKLKALWAGFCPYHPEKFEDCYAHAHANGEVCVKDFSLMYNEKDEPSEIMWHEYAHVIEQGDKTKNYWGHGQSWINALKELGREYHMAAITVPIFDTAEEVQSHLEGIRDRYQAHHRYRSME